MTIQRLKADARVILNDPRPLSHFVEASRLSRIYFLLLIAATLLAAACRITPSLNAPLWEDEVTTARFSNDAASVGSVLTNWIRGKCGVDPPLYYVLSRIVAPSATEPLEYQYRLVSLFCGIVAVPLMFCASRRLMGNAAAILAAFGLAVNGMAVAFSREHRSYSLLLLASILFYHAIHYLVAKPTAWRSVYFCAAAAALMYSHLFGVFPVAATVLILGVGFVSMPQTGGTRKQWFLPICTVAALVILVAPLLLQVAILARQESGLGKGSEYLDSGLYKEYIQFGRINKARDIWVWFSTYGVPSVFEKPVRYLSFFLILFGITGHWKRARISVFCMLGIAFLSTTLALAAYEVLRYPYQSRRLLFLLPVYVLYEAYGIIVLCDWLLIRMRNRYAAGSPGVPYRLVTVSPIILFILLSGIRVYFLKFREHGGLRDGDWRSIANAIRSATAPCSGIVFYDEQPLPNFTQFRYYRDLMLPAHPMVLVSSSTLTIPEYSIREAWGIVPRRNLSFDSKATSATLWGRFYGATLYRVTVPQELFNPNITNQETLLPKVARQ